MGANKIKGMYTCDVCGRDFPLIAEERTTILSPTGASHSAGMQSGLSKPRSAPAVAAVQSVSMPQFTAVQIVLPKSPFPASSARTENGTLMRTSLLHSLANRSKSALRTVTQSRD